MKKINKNMKDKILIRALLGEEAYRDLILKSKTNEEKFDFDEYEMIDNVEYYLNKDNENAENFMNDEMYIDEYF